MIVYETVTNRLLRPDGATLQRLRDMDEAQALRWLAEEGALSMARLSPPAYRRDFNAHRATIETRLPKLTLEVSRRCNLRCSYCVYSGAFPGRRSHQDVDMSWETLSAALYFYADHSRDLVEGEIGFYGGEALLRFEMIRCAVAHAREIMPGKALSFVISTNGLALTQSVRAWLAENPDVSVSVTLNGPAHDRYRKKRDGEGSLVNVMGNLERLRGEWPRVWQRQVNLLCNYASYDELMAQRTFYNDVIGKAPVLINPIVLPGVGAAAGVEGRDAVVEAFLREGDPFLSALFKNELLRVHRRDILPEGGTAILNSCQPLGSGVFVDAEGSFQVCTEMERAILLGDVRHGYDWQALRTLNDEMPLRCEACGCRDCWAQRLCCACLAHDPGTEAARTVFCEKARRDVENDLALYCRIASYHPAILERLQRKGGN